MKKFISQNCSCFRRVVEVVVEAQTREGVAAEALRLQGAEGVVLH